MLRARAKTLKFVIRMNIREIGTHPCTKPSGQFCRSQIAPTPRGLGREEEKGGATPIWSTRMDITVTLPQENVRLKTPVH